MSVFKRPCQRKTCKGKKKCSHKHWKYDFVIRGVRYLGSIPEARTKPQAKQAEIVKRSEVFNGTYGQPKEMAPLFSDFVRDIYTPYAREHKRSWRVEAWRLIVLNQHFGKCRLDQVTREHVEKFKTFMHGSITQRKLRRTKKDVNHFLEILSKIFSLAIEHEKIERAPKVELYTIPKKRPRYFTHEEEEKLMKQLTGTLSHLRPFAIVGIGTGLRPPSEIFGLKKSDVDFERDALRAGTKTNEEREIPIGPEVKAVLLELHAAHPESEYFFVNRPGKQRKVVKNGFRKALDNAGIRNASAYTMRHTFGTRLGAAGYSSYEIMALMGHKNIQTSAIYVGAVDERKRAAVESVFGVRSPVKSPAGRVEEKRLKAVND